MDAATSPHHPKFDRRKSLHALRIQFDENQENNIPKRRISLHKRAIILNANQSSPLPPPAKILAVREITVKIYSTLTKN